MTKTSVLLMLILIVPTGTRAQSSEGSWDNLRRLRIGQEIEVVDMKLKARQGAFRGYTEEAILLLRGRDEVGIPRADVLSVKYRGSSHRGRNALIGLAIGAASGLVAGAIAGATYHEEGETGVFILVFTPIGAGVGAGVGAVLPTGSATIYRARNRNFQ